MGFFIGIKAGVRAVIEFAIYNSLSFIFRDLWSLLLSFFLRAINIDVSKTVNLLQNHCFFFFLKFFGSMSIDNKYYVS